jgi:hypothetical protein
MFESLGGIKMAFALIALTIATAAMFLGKGTFAEWSSFAQWLSIALLSANGAITIASFFQRPDGPSGPTAAA